MMRTIEGNAFMRGGFVPARLHVSDGLITGIDELERCATESVIVPGFIDVHVHGGAGHDFMDPADDAADAVTRFHVREGTTALAATTLSSSPEDLFSAVQRLAQLAREPRDGAAQVAAIHLEGPYINAGRAGAQDRSSIRHPDLRELDRILAEAPTVTFMMTFAPEIEGAHAMLELFRDRILFSIGHTAATFGDAVDALQRGARHFTHLCNAMTGLHHRDPGCVGAALTSNDATAELIADGVHVHPAMLRILACSMPGRVALITDAMRACGLGEGSYKLYEHDVEVRDGAARLADGTLAGSVLTMRQAVQNMVELAGLPLESVIPLATSVPARILGVSDRKGTIEPGMDADLVVLDRRFAIERVFVRGKELV